MEAQIRDFWQYAAENITKIDMGELRKDLPFVNQAAEDPLSYVFKLSSSGIIYVQLINKARTICSDVHPMLGVQIIPLEQTDLLRNKAEKPEYLTDAEMERAKKCLLRIMINITADGNTAAFPVVETFYKISREFAISDDVLVTKYVPAQELNPDALIVHTQKAVLPPMVFQYRVHLLPNTAHDLDLVVTIDDGVAMQVITSQEDINSLRNGVFCMLEGLIGEYLTATYVKRLTVIPALLHRRHYPAMERDLRPLTEIVSDLAVLFPVEAKCLMCHVSEKNADLVDVNDDLDIQSGKYCTYCAAVLRRLVR